MIKFLSRERAFVRRGKGWPGYGQAIPWEFPYESKGDQVGSVASVGVGMGRSLKPAISMDTSLAE
jgi:hypothetical protein